MNKIIIFTCLLGLPFPMIINASPIDALKDVKISLEAAKKQINSSVEALKKGYEETQKSVVTKLETTVKSDVAPNVNLVKKAHDLSQVVRVLLIPLAAIPGLNILIVSALVIAGDVPEILNSIYNALVGVQNTLTHVKNIIQPANELLNPNTDPRGVYKSFSASEKKFDEAILLLDQIITLFETFFSAT